MRYVAVTGSRHLPTDASREDILDWLVMRMLPDAVLLIGEADGVDALARWWANHASRPLIVLAAPWKALRKAAGPARNEPIARAADEMLAFPCAHSRGTYDAINRFRAHHAERLAAVPDILIVREIACTWERAR